MKPISSIAKGISPSATMAIDSMAKQMKASGIDVISLVPVSLILILLTISRRPVLLPLRTIRPVIRPLPAFCLCVRRSVTAF